MSCLKLLKFVTKKNFGFSGLAYVFKSGYTCSDAYRELPPLTTSYSFNDCAREHLSQWKIYLEMYSCPCSRLDNYVSHWFRIKKLLLSCNFYRYNGNGFIITNQQAKFIIQFRYFIKYRNTVGLHFLQIRAG
jgi:hypothetical protein